MKRLFAFIFFKEAIRSLTMHVGWPLLLCDCVDFRVTILSGALILLVEVEWSFFTSVRSWYGTLNEFSVLCRRVRFVAFESSWRVFDCQAPQPARTSRQARRFCNNVVHTSSPKSELRPICQGDNAKIGE